VKEKTSAELHALLEAGTPPHLIDVREEHEHEAGNLGGELVPMGELLAHAPKIPRDRPVVLYCRTGARSGVAVRQLESRFGFDNLYNLRGGIVAYAAAFNPDLYRR
jgi:adenylyltransferase/sulfurtransferase